MSDIDPIYGLIEDAERAIAEALPLRPGAARGRLAVHAHGQLERAADLLRKMERTTAPDEFETLRVRLLAAGRQLVKDIFDVDPMTHHASVEGEL
jgi:hypothetical protein